MAEEEEVDYFELLSVGEEATQQEITKAYRKQALKAHPDKNPDDPEAGHKFHLLQHAFNVLSDPSARLALTKKRATAAARRARYTAQDAKRRKFADDLDAREKEFKRRRMDEKEAEKRRQMELERLREEGRRLREEKNRAASAAQQGVNAEKDAAETKQEAKAKAPELGPLDTSVRVRIPLNTHRYLLSESALSGLFSRFGPVDSVVLPPGAPSIHRDGSGKKKNATAVVSFKNLQAAYVAVLASSIASLGLGKIKVSWATGDEPEAVKRLGLTAPARDQNGGGQTEATANGDGGTANGTQNAGRGGSEDRIRPPSPPPPPRAAETFSFNSTPASAPPSKSTAPSFSFNSSNIPTSAPPVDYESATLLRMRQMERAKLEAEIRRRESEE